MHSEEDLAELFNKYGSDKDRNGYAQVYHTLFSAKKYEHLNILEIGIGTMISGAASSMVGYSLAGYKPGGSLRAWRDFFPNAEVIGCDVQPDTQFSDEPRIRTFLCDSLNHDSVDNLMAKLGNIKFDIILDDGLHYAEAQLQTLTNFYPHVKDNGIYIIEDVTNGSSISANPDQVKARCNNDPFFFVGVKNNICVINKNHINSKRENY